MKRTVLDANQATAATTRGTKSIGTRRDFLLGASTAVGAVAVSSSGCLSAGVGIGGASMADFACAPLPKVRLGLIGCGARGSIAVKRLLNVPGVEIVAVCDKLPERAEKTAASVAEGGRALPRRYSGEEGWKRLCDADDIDAMYNCTPWNLHGMMAVYAMKAGKHALVEVPGVMTIDECWECVKTAEKTRRHCMMLENCIYGEIELLMLNLARKGLLGEIVHGEGGYIHDRRVSVFDDVYPEHWRLRWNVDHPGNQYATHGLGPLANAMDLGRGDRMSYLVSLESGSFNYPIAAKKQFPADSWKRRLEFQSGDNNTTLIRTARGRSITLVHDVASPRVYSRINALSGTEGEIRDYPLRIFLQHPSLDYAHAHHTWPEKNEIEALREKYRHPLWKVAGERVKDGKVNDHGGMSWLMDMRWAYCLRNGLPLDTSVYDFADWSAVAELSERSVRNHSAPQDFPDFTDGSWRALKPRKLYDAI